MEPIKLTRCQDGADEIALSIIFEKGYDVTISLGGVITAKKGEDEFLSDDAVSLLGVITIGETYGEDWGAQQVEFDHDLVIFHEIE